MAITILITSGPTREYIDPVRFISNASSGKMGKALVDEALKQKCNVIVVKGPSDIDIPKGKNCKVINVISAKEMLSAVKQNLKFAVEKYQNSYLAEKEMATNPSLIEEAPKNNKIAVINEQIKGVQNDMKNNVKNMITNIQDINEIENKSVAIKDTSFQFRKDSLALEKKMRRNALRNKIILTIVVILILALFIYFIL